MGFKDRLHHAHGDGGDDGLADIGGVVFLLVEVSDRGDDGFAEGGEVRAAHGGVLAVDEGIVIFAVVPAMRHREFDVVAFEMDDRVERLAGEFFHEEIAEACLGFEGLAVEGEGEAAIEISVVPEHLLDELGAEFKIFAEERFVGRELDDRAVFLGGGGNAVILLQLALLKLDDLGLPIAHGLGAVLKGKRVDGFLADAVEADGFFERLAVVLSAGIDDRDAFKEFSQRDAASVVAHAHGALDEFDLDFFAKAHREFVDRVVDRLLNENVDAVLSMRAATEASDVHAWAEADVIGRGKGFDARFVVRVGHVISADSVGPAAGVTSENLRVILFPHIATRVLSDLNQRQKFP